MVATFFLVSNLKPYKKPRIFDVRITNDKHVVAVDMAKNPLDKSAIESVLKGSGAEEVNEKVFE